MIRDRGNIKWTSMMLPEHVKILRELEIEQGYAVKPVMDEQQLEHFNELISLAMEENRELAFTYYENHDFHVREGHVHYVDPIRGSIRIIDSEETRFDLPLDKITDIRGK
ncbi:MULTISPECIES: YolD-like family protein [Bacillaceae]|uniref:YolD-like family protein n=1 Tax=Bacillaceae TaxID=186817 RepID=UPI000C77B2C4|nr:MULTISPECIES: YolD-like family protein [Bacillaceae]PLR68024.1 YolD-like family protein [Bacillus sp. UMB0893]QNG61329.1 YolD-like family protein [Bacillus sp. PAMC26568]